MATKAILIDISDTLIVDKRFAPGAAGMILRLQAAVPHLYYVATERWRMTPSDPRIVIPDHKVLSSRGLGGKKGSGKLVKHVISSLGLEPHEILYVGDTDLDMREAKNSGVLFLRADWSSHPNKTQYGMPFSYPLRLARAVESWFLKDFPWYFQLEGTDNVGRNYLYQALMDNKTTEKFGVRQLLKVGKGADTLFRQLAGELIGSVYGDGLFQKDFNDKDPIVAVYPSSQPGAQNRVLDRIVSYTSKLVGIRSLPDLIIRHRKSEKSAYRRTDGLPVYFSEQMNTIVLNPDHAQKVKGRTIVVFDDFTTDGYSLEAARNYLYNAGASDVICIAAGKYNYNRSIVCTPKPGTVWDSFVPYSFVEEHFDYERVQGMIDNRAVERFKSDAAEQNPF